MTLVKSLPADSVVLVNLSGRGDKDVQSVVEAPADEPAGRSTFARLRQQKTPGLVTYVTAGDPDLARTGGILRALDRAGADVVEVGVPFSDPLADGPVIQRATERALESGTTLVKVLDLLAGLRDDPAAAGRDLQLRQPDPAARGRAVRGSRPGGGRGRRAGAGPADRGGRRVPRADGGARAIDTILLVSPTTSDHRLRRAAALGSGFLYAISRLGVTGIRDQLAEGAEDMVRRIRGVSDMPVALGFGISRPEHVREVGRWADAAVVGSALVNVIAEAGSVAGARISRGGVRAVAEGLSIEDLRKRIDLIDAQLVRLLNVRVACAVEVGRLKHEAGLAVYQPDREAQVLNGVRRAATELAGPLTAEAVVRIFERIIDEARRAERQKGKDGAAPSAGAGGVPEPVGE